MALIFAFIAIPVVADVMSTMSSKTGEQLILEEFTPLFAKLRHEPASNDLEHDLFAYYGIVDSQFRPHWDARSLVRQLIGSEEFMLLDDSSKSALIITMEDTLRRYAFENRKRYLKGRFTLVGADYSKDGKKGSLEVLMEVPFFPDLTLNVLLNQTSEGGWRAFDLGFRGITYIDLKKREYRRILKRKGVEGLIAKLQKKNNNYFKKLCSKLGVQGEPPC